MSAERTRSIATATRAADAGGMAKRKSDPHVVHVKPYIARPMMDRPRPADVPADQMYYRIGLKGRRLKGETGWCTAEQVRDRMIELVIGARVEAMQIEAAAKAAAEPTPWTVRDLMETWIGTVVDEMDKGSTRTNYRLHAVRLVALFPDLRLDRMTRDTMKRMQRHLGTQAAVDQVIAYRRAQGITKRSGPVPTDGYGGSTVNGTMAALRNAWNWAAELGHAPLKVPRFSNVPANPVFATYTPTEAEIFAAIDKITSIAVQRALLLQAATGARISEITKRTVGDVARAEGSAEDGTLTVWLDIRKTKTKVDRTVPVRRWAGEMLLKMIEGRTDPDEMLFTHAGHRDDDGSDDVARIVKRMRTDIGKPVAQSFAASCQRQLRALPWGELDGERFTPHGERRYFINAALNSNQALHLVARCCGNSPATIARHYLHVTPAQLVDVVDRVDGAADNVVPLRRRG